MLGKVNRIGNFANLKKPLKNKKPPCCKSITFHTTYAFSTKANTIQNVLEPKGFKKNVHTHKCSKDLSG